MARISSLEVMQKVAEVAKEAKLLGAIDEAHERYYLSVELPTGRVQNVLVRDNTPSSSDNMVVSVFSPCLIMSLEDFNATANAEMPWEILKANEELNFAKYGLYETEEEIMMVASYQMLLDTMTPDDFKSSVYAVAIASDMFTEKYSMDEGEGA